MSFEVKNILVPIDFSETADNALQVAAAMASRHEASIHLLHVVQPHPYVDPIGVHGPISGIEQMLMIDANKNLERYRIDIQKNNGIKVITHVELGTVAVCISNYVINNHKDLVVMGSHGVSGWNEFLLGSNAMATIKGCSCPVLTIPSSFKKRTFDSVLYPIRNVEGAVEKYQYIKDIIQKNGSKIHLLSLLMSDEAYRPRIQAGMMNEVLSAIGNNSTHISSETQQCTDIAAKVLEVAHSRNDDMMIINATLDRHWFNFFIGSYTRKIVNHSKIPVLSVKPSLIHDPEK